MGYFRPIITDDLRLLSGYRDPRPDPLPCPLFLFQGEDDNVTVDNWAFYSTSRVDLTYFSGGHFFITEHVAEIAEAIIRRLEPIIQDSVHV